MEYKDIPRRMPNILSGGGSNREGSEGGREEMEQEKEGDPSSIKKMA